MSSRPRPIPNVFRLLSLLVFWCCCRCCFCQNSSQIAQLLNATETLHQDANRTVGGAGAARTPEPPPKPVPAVPPHLASAFLGGNVPGAYAIAPENSFDEDEISPTGTARKAWPGLLEVPHRPLSGLTYYPWRLVEDCRNVTGDDVTSDLELLATVTSSIYVERLFCDFALTLVNATRRLSMTIMLGLAADDEQTFLAQTGALASVLHSGLNLSHVVAVTVPVNKSESANATAKLAAVGAVLANSSYPKIPVSMAVEEDMVYDGALKRKQPLPAIVVSVNVLGWKNSPGEASEDLFEKVIVVRNLVNVNGSVVLTGFGWPSAGPPLTDPFGKFYNQSTDQQQRSFVSKLVCNKFPPDAYYLHSAFDLLWRYPPDTAEAYFGLADAVTRRLKPHVVDALAECDDHSVDSGLAKRMSIVSISVVIALLLAMMLLVIYFWWRKREAVRSLKLTKQQLTVNGIAAVRDGRSSSAVSYLNSSLNSWDGYLNVCEPDYNDMSDMISPELHIDLAKLELKEIVGKGHFGVVQRASYYSSNEKFLDVAVKRLHVGGRNVRRFLLEGIQMQKFHHKNVLNLVGISFTENNMPLIVTAFLDRGDLLSFVKTTDKANLSVLKLSEFALQIAEGMRYLHELKVIHRDLAARNCMLDESLTVKIADFGLCRDISESDSYQATQTFELPIRWMPPEAIELLRWTSKSDVWSYGVVLWELFSRGRQPYDEIPLLELRAYLRSGKRLQSPEECPEMMYEIMTVCWRLNPIERPEFVDLCQSLPFAMEDLQNGRKKSEILTRMISSIKRRSSTPSAVPTPSSPWSKIFWDLLGYRKRSSINPARLSMRLSKPKVALSRKTSLP